MESNKKLLILALIVLAILPLLATMVPSLSFLQPLDFLATSVQDEYYFEIGESYKISAKYISEPEEWGVLLTHKTTTNNIGTPYQIEKDFIRLDGSEKDGLHFGTWPMYEITTGEGVLTEKIYKYEHKIRYVEIKINEGGCKEIIENANLNWPNDWRECILKISNDRNPDYYVWDYNPADYYLPIEIVKKGELDISVIGTIPKEPEPTDPCDDNPCEGIWVCSDNYTEYLTQCEPVGDGYECTIDYRKYVGKNTTNCPAPGEDVCLDNDCDPFMCHEGECYKVVCVDKNGFPSCEKDTKVTDSSCVHYLGYSCKKSPPTNGNDNGEPCPDICEGNIAYYQHRVDGVCVKGNIKQTCSGHICDFSTNTKYENICKDGECVRGNVLEEDSAHCGYNPCAGVECPSICDGKYVIHRTCKAGICEETMRAKCNPICVGNDRYETTCSEGKCIKGSLIEINHALCTDPCEGITCENVCVGDDLYSQYCYNGKCYKGSLIEKCSTLCDCMDKCKDVKCLDICVGYELYSRECDPTTGLCLKGDKITDCSLACGCPGGIPYDGDGIAKADDVEDPPKEVPDTHCDAGIIDARYKGESVGQLQLAITETINTNLIYKSPQEIYKTKIYVGDETIPSFESKGYINYYNFPLVGNTFSGKVVTEDKEGCIATLNIALSQIDSKDEPKDLTFDYNLYARWLIILGILGAIGFLMIGRRGPKYKDSERQPIFEDTPKKRRPGRPRTKPKKEKVPGRRPGRPPKQQTNIRRKSR